MTSLPVDQVLLGDNLPILASLPEHSVDLIYLDPPFNTGRDFKSFDDRWVWSGEVKHNIDVATLFGEKILRCLEGLQMLIGQGGRLAYLYHLAPRICHLRRILKPSGSLFFHCDPTASHYIKVLLDAVFGCKNFRNEIVWQRRQDTHNLAKKQMGRMHDLIFYYAVSEQTKYRIQYSKYDSDYVKSKYCYEDEQGRYALFPCANEAGNNKPYYFRGMNRCWRFKPERMQAMWDQGLLVQPKAKSPFRYKKYLASALGIPLQDLWTNIPPARGNEQVGYPTQKPEALLERIIKASSHEGDIVLDPYCGSGTACVVANRLARRFIGMDSNPEAVAIAHKRLQRQGVSGA